MIEDVHQTTPSGETGVEDLRTTMGEHGRGHVADSNSESARQAHSNEDAGPSYEQNQGRANPSTGGSSDPHNTLTHADSGDETPMMNDVDNQNRSGEVVDGFTDTEGETNVASPDPGGEEKNKPLSPEEYAKAQKEERSAENNKE